MILMPWILASYKMRLHSFEKQQDPFFVQRFPDKEDIARHCYSATKPIKAEAVVNGCTTKCLTVSLKITSCLLVTVNVDFFKP